MKIKRIELDIKARLNYFWEKVFNHVKSPFFKDVSAQLLLIATFVLVLVAWIFSFYYFRATSYLVPLRYSSFLGFFDLGRWYQLYELPFFFTLCIILNTFLGNIIYKKDKFLAYIVVASNIFIALIAITLILNFGRALN